MANQFIYTITTGRSGTVFLADLLKENLNNATVFHERAGFPNFGINTPDASHFTTFNNIGVNDHVRYFWQQKLTRDSQTKTTIHCEVSHFLSKAGLIENLSLLPNESKTHIILLKRDPWKIFWSYLNRFDFMNSGFTWLFTLDSRYKNVIIKSDIFQQHGVMGNALWYVWEMFARMSYYREILKKEKNIFAEYISLEEVVQPEGAAKLMSWLIEKDVPVNNIVIPGVRNETKFNFLGEDMLAQAKEVFEKLSCDPEALGKEFYERGFRLGTLKGHL